MDLLTDIGKRVRETREHYKLTREQLAEMASISPQFLVHIENGTKSMTAKTICNLSKALNISADYLLFGSQDNDLNRILTMEALASMSVEEKVLAERILQTVLHMVRNTQRSDIAE